MNKAFRILVMSMAAILTQVSLAHSSQTFNLTVTKTGAGNGTLSAPNVNCGSTCSATYLSGRKVALNAKPDSNSVFVAWSGACSGTGTCIVTMNSDINVVARFEPKEPRVSVFPDTLDFGTVASDERTSSILRIGNTGTADLQVTISNVAGSDFAVDKSSFTVKPHNSRNVKFTLTPSQSGISQESEASVLAEANMSKESPDPSSSDPSKLVGTVFREDQKAAIQTNDSTTPEVDVPLLADVMVLQPGNTDFTLVVRHSLRELLHSSGGEIDSTYSQIGTITFGIVEHKTNGAPSLKVECGGGSCVGAVPFKDEGTVTFPGDSSCSTWTLAGTGSVHYKLSGVAVNNNANLQLKLLVMKVDAEYTVCPPANCGSCSTWQPGNYIFDVGKVQIFKIPFSPGASHQQQVNSPPMTGTLEWDLQFDS